MIQHVELIKNNDCNIELRIDTDAHSIYVIKWTDLEQMPRLASPIMELFTGVWGVVPPLFHVKKIDPDTIMILDGLLSGKIAKRKGL